MITDAAMRVILVGLFVVLLGAVNGQVINDPNSGVVVKTFYLPLNKGSSSSSHSVLRNFQPVANANVPYVPVRLNGDLQLESSQNQNYHSNVKPDAHPVQNVKVKINTYTNKVETYNQPQYVHDNNQPPAVHQQYQNAHHQTQNAVNSNFAVPHPHYNQHQTQAHPQYGSHLSNISYGPQTSDVSNVQQYDSYPQINSQVHPSGRQTSYTQQSYPQALHNTVTYNTSPTKHANPHQVQSQSYHGEEAQNAQTYDRDGNGHYQNPNQASYFSQTSERPLSGVTHQQMNYVVQNSPENSHTSSENWNSNSYQNPHSHEIQEVSPTHNRQHHQAVNTYAIVHQRTQIPSHGTQSSKVLVNSNQAHGSNHDQSAARITSDGNHQELHKSIPAEYINAPNQMPSHQVSSQYTSGSVPASNTFNSFQYPSKQISNAYYAESSPNVAASPYQQIQSVAYNRQVQRANPGSEHSHNQRRSPQGLASQNYPDPSSETFFPENKQVYIAPPTDYKPELSTNHQGHLQQAANQQAYVKYSVSNKGEVIHAQVPISSQTEQIGIHIPISSGNHYAQRTTSSPQYSYSYE